VNIIAIRAEDKDKPWVAKLVAAYHSPEVKQFVATKFGGSVITAW
jgi:D-methionine transport system substrate-binding protein